MSRLIVLATAVALAIATATAASAAQINHDRFVSDPYQDNWCGLDGTSIDDVVANYRTDGAHQTLRVKTTFTASASGKTMEIEQSGLRVSDPPVDKGNGTYSVTFANSGPSPKIMLPTGKPIVDTGFLEAVVTFDSATDDFIDFQLVKQAGSRPPGCDRIIAAMS